MYSSAYVWARVLAYIEKQLDPAITAAWFENADVVALTDEKLILYSPSEFSRDVIRRRCTQYIKEAMQELFNATVEVEVYDERQLQEYRTGGRVMDVLDFNPQYTFDSFVVGGSNEFAHGAAIAVANNPGGAYNPLFIYGPPGIGKTHLIYAIANDIRRKDPTKRIVYIRGDDFTNEMITAIQTGKNVEFRSKYREADLFLVDDIQFIAGKESTQEEFFHTFNTLYESHRQIVLTSDRKPSDMLTLQDRLRTRFEWGLIADIQPPDYETRMAILRNKATSMGLNLPEDVCNYIATNITSNVRQIEGTVKKIQAYRDLTQMPLDLPNVSRAISDMFKSENAILPTPSLIISQVSKFYSIDETVLRGTLRNRGTAEARQVAMYLIRTLTHMSLPDIGAEFGRDHTTVMHSLRKVEQMLKDESSGLSNNIRDITANINSLL